MVKRTHAEFVHRLFLCLGQVRECEHTLDRKPLGPFDRSLHTLGTVSHECIIQILASLRILNELAAGAAKPNSQVITQNLPIAIAVHRENDFSTFLKQW